jgi:ADP-L-glycero-D-manno-heptose 6-epimerase
MIAVTGAAGFIGSNLAHRLAADGHELLLVDEPITEVKAANLVGLPAHRYVTPQQFPDLLTKEQPQLDAIFHLGACSSTTETDWNYLLRNNVQYTQTLWAWCTDRRVPFLYASSAATYGDGSQGFDDRTPPEQLTPLNLYGKSKNDFDLWALQETNTPPMWAGLKFFNVYGPREAHKGGMASVVYHARRQILETGRMKLFRSNDPAYPDGGQLRDFVFVNDNIDHLLWLWKQPGAAGVFNSGTGQARTFGDLVRAVFAAQGKEPEIEFIDMPASLSAQYQNYTQAEMMKLRSMGYTTPATTLEDGVKKTVQWLTAGR